MLGSRGFLFNSGTVSLAFACVPNILLLNLGMMSLFLCLVSAVLFNTGAASVFLFLVPGAFCLVRVRCLCFLP